MIGRSTNITTIHARNLTGHPSTDVGTLCSSPRINKYSRFRPGYWSLFNQVLTFNLPAGGGVNDPRGIDPNTGSNAQLYKLGDFRLYNSDAYAPYVFGAPEETIYIPNNQSTGQVSYTVNFNLGEVDWWGDEWLNTTYWHGRNDLPTHWEYVYAFNPSTMATYGKAHRSQLETSGYNSRMIFDVSVNTPGQGATTTITIQFGIGTNAKVEAKFPDVYKTLKFYRSPMPQWTLIVPSFGNAYDNLTNSLSGLIAEDLTPSSKAMYCDFTPYSGNVPIGSNTLSVQQAAAVVTMYPTYNRYRVSQLRWQVTARIVCYANNNVNNIVWQDSRTVTMALSGDGYTYSFPIPQIVQDGYNYMIYLEDFGNTSVSRTF